MKKRLKKQMAELMEVTYNIGKALEVLAAVDAKIKAEETKLLKIRDMAILENVNAGDIDKRLKKAEFDINKIKEAVGDLIMTQHTHWWK